jgi:hypothetical protein
MKAVARDNKYQSKLSQLNVRETIQHWQQQHHDGEMLNDSKLIQWLASGGNYRPQFKAK